MRNETEKLIAAIRYGAQALKPIIPWADTTALLAALAEMESAFGVHNRPRFEPAYAPGGFYYKKSEEQRNRFIEWGAWSACSYSSFQIMYPTACELGYDSAPWSRNPGDLMHDEVAIHFVVEYMKRRVMGREEISTVKDVGVVYNGGSLSTTYAAAHVYGKNLETAYGTVLARRGLTLAVV